MSEMSPVSLQDVSKEDFKKFLDSFDHVFSDCDGVIWVQDPIPGAGEFFKLMESLGKTVHFVSNNSLKNDEKYKDNFQSSGIENGVERLTVPSVAIAEYLKSVNFTQQLYCVASSETVKVLERNGFKCKYGPVLIPENYRDFTQFLEDDTDIGAVVFDSDYKVNLPKIYKAITYLKRPEVLFINGATDRYVTMKPGCLSLGTGVFTDIVEQESKKTPIQIGKPGKLFGEIAMRRNKVTDPSRVLFIGDMLAQDVGLGKATGFHTLLVLTYCTKERMLEQTVLSPDYYAASLGHLLEKLREQLE